MNLVRILGLLLFPLMLCGQRVRPHLLDLADYPIEQSDRSFIVTDVIDSTTYGDSGYGVVYTGLANIRRNLQFRGNLTVVLKQALFLGITDRDLPRARLIVHDLRIDEEIILTSERRRLQLRASLEIMRDGTPVRLGPLQETEVKGGIEVTGGHPAALSDAIGRLLDRFHLMHAGGGEETRAASYVRDTDPLLRPDGVYHTYTDFRMGRVDTSVHLQVWGIRTQAELDHMTFLTASPYARQEEQARDLKAIWGFHEGGHSYLQVARKFYELVEDGRGNTLVYVKGGILDPQVTSAQMLGGALGGALGVAMASSLTNSTEQLYHLYRLDLKTGGLSPYEISYEKVYVAGRTMLYSKVAPGGGQIEVHRTTGTELLGPGEYLLLEPGEEVSFSVQGSRGEPVSRQLREGSRRLPSLYRLSIQNSGGVGISKANRNVTRQLRSRIESGRIEPAR